MSEQNPATETAAPTVDEVVTAIPVPLLAAMRREKRSGLRKVVELDDGRRMCLTISRRRRAKVKITRNVPDEVGRLTEAFQRVFLGLQTCRQTKAAHEEVTAVDVHRAVSEQPEGELALETVYRGLKKLTRVNEVRKAEATGYHIGKHTIGMTFSDSHSELPVQPRVEEVESITVN